MAFSGEPRHAQNAGPWIVLIAGDCALIINNSGLHRGLHKKKPFCGGAGYKGLRVLGVSFEALKP